MFLVSKVTHENKTYVVGCKTYVGRLCMKSVSKLMRSVAKLTRSVAKLMRSVSKLMRSVAKLMRSVAPKKIMGLV